MLTARLADVKFLLVDDLDENLYAFEQTLRREGLTLISARSGASALEALLVHDFALAIIDVEMPGMDGVALAELMRGTDRTRHVPIIFVTAGSRERQKLFRGYEAGAVDFLYKPIETVVLRNKAETFFELSRQRQQLALHLELLQEQQRCLARRNDDLAIAQNECRRARDVAEATNRAKDEFLANVSHEIRTPMNAILGMTELVLDTPLSEGQRQSLKTVRSAARSLLGTINDVLDFSKIEAGKLVLDPTEFSLREALAEVLRALCVRAHDKGLELICDVHPQVPDIVVGDVSRLRQVLTNLLSNAIKFTEVGEVVLQIGVGTYELPCDDLAGERHVELHLSILDTGIGIPLHKQRSIFQAFEQEDMSTTRKYGGTGLGLTIAARLIALMGGDLSVRSELGRGSTFSFTARFGCPARPARVEILPRLFPSSHVLVVDDNAMSRNLLEAWLRDWQLETSTLGDADTVLETLHRGLPAGESYALVLLDASLPGEGGLALAAAIRASEVVSGTPIVLLTGLDRPPELERYRELKINAHLPKPVLRNELLETLHTLTLRTDKLAAHSAPLTEAAGEAPAMPACALRVLVAEDNEFNSELLVQLLARRGHQVQLAQTGREALRLVDEDDYDLLLLDVHMPELDGFSVIQTIRKREQTSGARLPVVAVTARSRREDRQRCLEAGMDDFLVKPINAAELWAAIERVRPQRLA